MSSVVNRKMHTGYSGLNLKERVQFKDLDLDRRKVIKWIFKKKDGGPRLISCGYG